MEQKPRILYITEFKNQFDGWQPLHAYNSKNHACLDAGVSGRVLEVIEYSAVQELVDTLKWIKREIKFDRKEDPIIRKCNEALAKFKAGRE